MRATERSGGEKEHGLATGAGRLDKANLLEHRRLHVQGVEIRGNLRCRHCALALRQTIELKLQFKEPLYAPARAHDTRRLEGAW